MSERDASITTPAFIPAPSRRRPPFARRPRLGTVPPALRPSLPQQEKPSSGIQGATFSGIVSEPLS